MTAEEEKIDALAYALAQARPFVKWDAEHSTAALQALARNLLARIDKALEGTIHDPRKAEAARERREAVECAQIEAGEISRYLDPRNGSDP
jgi:hypothetical protein